MNEVAKFNEQTVKRAFWERVKQDQVLLYAVNPAQIHQDVYPRRAVGGVTFYFVCRIKKDLIKIQICDAVEKQIAEKSCDLADIDPKAVVHDVYGDTPPQEALAQVAAVWFSLQIAEGIAQRKAAREARSKYRQGTK